MTTHPVLAGVLYAIGAFFCPGAVFFAFASSAAQAWRLKVGFAVLCLVTAAIIGVLAAAGRVLL